MLSVVSLYIFFPNFIKMPTCKPADTECYYCIWSEVIFAAGETVKHPRHLYPFHILLRQMRFRLWVLTARIRPETKFMCFSLAAVGSQNELCTVNPTATNKARGTYDATCMLCVDEVSTLGRQFSGWFSCVVGILAEETVNATQIQSTFMSHQKYNLLPIVASGHSCHKHHKLTFWYVWFTVLRETWSCLNTQTEVSSGDH